MPLVELTVANLADLDAGMFAAALEHDLKSLVRDCMDRPALTKPRTLTIKLRLKPVMHERRIDGVSLGYELIPHIPSRHSDGTTLRAEPDGSLIFSTTSRDVDQTTIHDIDPATGQIDRRTAAAGPDRD